MAGPGAQMFGDEERWHVNQVLESGHLSRYGNLDDTSFGRKVFTLERDFAAVMDVEHALAVNSGTSALLVSLLALGIGEGDEVLVPGFTYVATIAAVVHARATPVLVEVDASLTMDAIDLAAKITDRSKAVVPVHMLGVPCDMAKVTAVASENNLHVIEDCCQAVGGSFQNRRLGTFGDCGVYSFNRAKILSAGEGGMWVSASTDLYHRAFALHDQGHLPLRATKERVGSAANLVGLNLKMNELTGAVALAQLGKLEQILHELRRRKTLLIASLGQLPGVTVAPTNDRGECATVLTLRFESADQAVSTAGRLGTTTLDRCGWHHYSQMTHISRHQTASKPWPGRPVYAAPGDLPRTDDLLRRSVNISVGVVDPGIGAGFGVDLSSADGEIVEIGSAVKKACRA